MILVGRYASPFVRRVGVSLQWLGVPYEHRVLSTAKDVEAIRAFNPMAKVPVLVLGDGEHLVDSSAILDSVLETIPGQRLLPASGRERLRILQVCAVTTNALDKAIQIIYEPLKRPPEKVHEPFLDSLRGQVSAGLAMLEGIATRGGLPGGDGSTLADITVAVGWRFLTRTMPQVPDKMAFPRLAGLSARCEPLPAFMACQPEA